MLSGQMGGLNPQVTLVSAGVLCAGTSRVTPLGASSSPQTRWTADAARPGGRWWWLCACAHLLCATVLRGQLARYPLRCHC